MKVPSFDLIPTTLNYEKKKKKKKCENEIYHYNNNIPSHSPRMTGAAVRSNTRIVMTKSKSIMFLAVALLVKRFRRDLWSDVSIWTSVYITI